MNQLASGVVYYIVFLLSTTLHEAAHAWAAKRGGDLTVYHGGQVSIDPRPHIRREPFGMVVLPILTVMLSGWPFGYASAPYDAVWAQRYPRRAALMSLAGPGANLAMVILAAVIMNVGVLVGVLQPPASVSFAHVTAAAAPGMMVSAAFILSVVFSLNLVLLVLNILPVPPLDGSGALPLLLPESLGSRLSQLLAGNSALAWFGIFIAWKIFDVVFNPVFLFVVNLVYPGVSYG